MDFNTNTAHCFNSYSKWIPTGKPVVPFIHPTSPDLTRRKRLRCARLKSYAAVIHHCPGVPSRRSSHIKRMRRRINARRLQLFHFIGFAKVTSIFYFNQEKVLVADCFVSL